MTSSKTVSCKLGVKGPSFLNVIDDGIIYCSPKFCVIQIRHKFLKFGGFHIYCVAQCLEDISCSPTWLPPYKPKEIVQSLSGHYFDISRTVSTQSFESTFKMVYFTY